MGQEAIALPLDFGAAPFQLGSAPITAVACI